MKRRFKWHSSIFFLLPSVVFMNSADIISMIMVAIAIHLFVSRYPLCKEFEPEWAFALISVMYIPQNVLLVKEFTDKVVLIFDGVVTLTSIVIITYLFLFSMEQIIFGGTASVLRELSKSVRARGRK